MRTKKIKVCNYKKLSFPTCLSSECFYLNACTAAKLKIYITLAITNYINGIGVICSCAKWIIVFAIFETLVLAFVYVGHHLKKKGVRCGITAPAFPCMKEN